MCRIFIKEAEKEKIYLNNVDLNPQEFDLDLLRKDAMR
jgi:hypothetical protein